MTDVIHYLDILGLILASAFFHGLSVYIYLQNRKSLGNKGFAALLFFLGQWALSHVFIVTNTRPEWALAFWRWSPVTAVFIVSMVFYFALIFPEERDIARWGKILIFGPAIFLSLASLFTDTLVKDFVIVDPSFIYLGQRIYGPLYGAYLFDQTFFAMGGAIWAVLKTLRLRGNKRIKMSFVAVALLLNAVSALIFAVWLPRLGLLGFYSLGPISVLFGACLITYSIVKYRLFVVTPQLAAKEILETLSVIVTDLSGNTLYHGEAVEEVSQEQRKHMVERLLREGNLSGYRVEIKQKSYNVSAALVKEGGGVVMLFYDISEIEEEKEKEEDAHRKLALRYEKERNVRQILQNLVTTTKICQTFKSAVEILGEEPEAMQALERMVKLMQDRQAILTDVEKDKTDIEERLSEIKLLNEALVEQELKMIALKKNISALKGEEQK